MRKIFLIVLIILVIGGGCFCFFSRVVNTTEKPDFFYDKKLGISFDYPFAWVQAADTPVGFIFEMPYAASSFIVSRLERTGDAKEVLEELLAPLKSNHFSLIRDLSIKVDSLNARDVMFSCSDKVTSFRGRIVLTEKKDDGFYAFVLMTGDEKYSGENNRDFERVIKSVKFEKRVTG